MKKVVSEIRIMPDWVQNPSLWWKIQHLLTDEGYALLEQMRAVDAVAVLMAYARGENRE